MGQRLEQPDIILWHYRAKTTQSVICEDPMEKMNLWGQNKVKENEDNTEWK